MGLQQIERASDTRLLLNETTSKPAFFRAFAKDCQSEIELLSDAAQRSQILGVGGLEELILETLANVKDDAELTTTEIARAIKFFFDVDKSKNNVSRYFNQEFHSFFRVGSRSGKNVYRLSGSGKSIARILEVQRGLRELA